jgi:hypothetical protein
VKFSDTISFLIKELTPPHSGLYRLGLLQVNFLSVTLTVTFPALASLMRSTRKNNTMLVDGNAMACDKKPVGERLVLLILFTRRMNLTHKNNTSAGDEVLESEDVEYAGHRDDTSDYHPPAAVTSP